MSLDLDAGAAVVSSDLGKGEKVYMKISPGFEQHYGLNKVFRLHRVRHLDLEHGTE